MAPNSPKTSASGPKLLLYRNPHMIAPMTVGIAYGRKIMSRANRANIDVTASRMRAIASAMPICSGIATSEKRMTNHVPDRKLGSVNALR